MISHIGRLLSFRHSMAVDYESMNYHYVTVARATTIITVLIGVLLNNANMNARFALINGRFAVGECLKAA